LHCDRQDQGRLNDADERHHGAASGESKMMSVSTAGSPEEAATLTVTGVACAAAAHSIAMTAAADFAVAASSRDLQLIQAQPI
jgi:hypothetical protein